MREPSRLGGRRTWARAGGGRMRTNKRENAWPAATSGKDEEMRAIAIIIVRDAMDAIGAKTHLCLIRPQFREQESLSLLS